MLTIGTDYYNRLQQFLIYKGKKSITESLFRKLILLRAKKKKNALNFDLQNCKYNATPYIRLKTRVKRRGKRTLYRVDFLERIRSEKKSWFVFGKYLRNQKPQNFISSLEKEIESFSQDKNHALLINRDKIHRLARKQAPKAWFLFKKTNFLNSEKKKKLKHISFRNVKN